MTMQRRTFLQSAGAMAAGSTLAGLNRTAGAADADRPPNLLFVLADQWRFSAFSHETDPTIRTPNFDRFVDQGARWTRTYAANPVCTPNRSCILTGRYAHQHGMITNNLMIPPSERCIAESFADAGYATHYIGKWHMDGEPKPGFVPPGWRRRGFETFEGFNRGHSYYETGTFSNEGVPTPYEGFEPTYQTDLAIYYMKAHREDPFFCYLSWGPPHTPYNPPPGFEHYGSEPLEFRPNVPDDLRANPSVRKQLAGYYGLCEALDHEMGRIMAALDENGLADNTLVVFTSDHGDMHHSHRLIHKGHPEDESLHVPLFMRMPGTIRAGQKIDTLACSIDLMPTMTRLCGLDAPTTCTGRDLSAAVDGGTAPDVESVYSEGRMQILAPKGAWRSLVTPTHKLAINIEGKVTHLFDLEKDPYEMNNLSGERTHSAVEKELLAEMRRWAKETGDPYPAKVPAAKKMYSDEEAAQARA